MGLDQYSLGRLRQILRADPDVFATIAAALWARAGRVTTAADLLWAGGLGVSDAPQFLHHALEQTGAIVAGRLDVMGLQRFISLLLEAPQIANGDDGPSILWTLPRLQPGSLHGQSLLNAIRQLLHDAKREVILAAPYIESRGVGLIGEELRAALNRGLTVIVVGHDLLDLGSGPSQAVEPLRRDARDLPGRLEVFSAVMPSTAPRDEHPLIHGKLVVADDSVAIVSSANLTIYGLTSNFEIGARLIGPPAQETMDTMRQILRSRLVTKVFTSGTTR